RVVGQRDPDVAVQRPQRMSEAVGQPPRVPDELLHLRLAELRRAPAGEPAAEPLAAGHAEPAAGQVQLDPGALEHVDAGQPQHPGDVRLLVALVVMVAQHRDDGHADVAELLGDDLGLRHRAVLGEIAGQQQRVGLLAEAVQMRPDGTADVRTEVHIAHGGYPDHGVRTSVSITSLRNAISGASSVRTSAATAATSARRCSPATSPRRLAIPPATSTRMPSSWVRGSVASACSRRPARFSSSAEADPAEAGPTGEADPTEAGPWITSSSSSRTRKARANADPFSASRTSLQSTCSRIGRTHVSVR